VPFKEKMKVLVGKLKEQMERERELEKVGFSF
jgi:hypothetical protein